MSESKEMIGRFLARGAKEARAAVVDDFAGAREWKSNWRRSALGVSRLVGVVRSGFLPGSIGLGGAFRGLVAKALSPVSRVPLDTELADPAERFAFAQEAYGRPDEGVARAIDVTYEKYLTYLGVAACLIALDVATARSIGHLIPAWLDIASRISPVIIALLFSFRAGFENWILRTRRLGSIREFVGQPGEWWAQPAPGWMSRTRGPVTMLILVGSAAIAGSVLFSSQSAEAASVGAAIFSAPSPSDFWLRLLGFVFPQVGPITVGQVLPIDNAIGKAFGAMSAALMACATAYVAYQTVIGIGESAHSGEPLGNRYHTMWGPIRVAYGFGMLAPVAGGYCLAQLLVLTVAIAGGQIANAEWSAFVDGLNPTEITVPALEETLPLVRDTLLLETCHAVATHIRLDDTPPWPTTYSNGPMTMSNNLLARGARQIWYRVVSAWDSAQTAGVQAPVAVYQARWNYGICGSITADYSTNTAGADADVAALDTARIAAFDELRGSLKAIATTVSDSVSPELSVDWSQVSPDLFTKVVAAKATYDRKVIAAVTAYTATASKVSLSGFQDAAKLHGWISAGPYFMTLARIDGQVLSLTHVAPAVSLVDKSEFTQGSDASKRLTDPVVGALPRLMKWWDASVAGNTTLSMSAANAGRFNNNGSIAGATEYLGSVDSGVQAWVLKQASVTPGQGNALQQMVDFGNILLTVCETILVALGAGAIFGGAAGLTPSGLAVKFGKSLIPGGAIDKIAGFAVVFAGLIAVALLVAGIMHAYILPLLPFLLFTFAVMDLLVMVVCGVIAAPIWALFHITFEGEELFKGRHGEGYMINFNLLLRPGLTLFGLFFSIHVFEAMIWLLSVTIYPAMASATSGHFFGLIGTLVYVVVIAVLNYQVAIRSFHLITQVPSRVARWFGASPDGDGGEEHSRSAMGLVMSHSKSGIDTAANAARGAGGQTMAAAGAAIPGGAVAQGAGALAGQVARAGNAVGSRVRPPPA